MFPTVSVSTLDGAANVVPEREPMTDEDLEAAIRLQVTDAVSFIDTQVSWKREKADRYYNGEKFGDEQPGRSSVVSQDVKDVILAILPSLLNIFFSSERAVEYVARIAPKAAEAAQATDYINYILTEDNQGFLVFHSWFKDALKNKNGIVKAWMEDADAPTTERYEGISPDQRTMLMLDPDVHVLSERSYLDPQGMVPPPPQGVPLDTTGAPMQLYPQLQPGTLHDMIVSRVTRTKRFKVVCLPPEEFLISRTATSIEGADFVAHRASLPASDLIKMGYPADLVEEFGSSGQTLAMNPERIARQSWMISTLPASSVTSDPSMKLVDYFECYVRTDYDNDGVAELRRVCLMGEGMQMVDNRAWDEAPFASCCPDPEPHLFFGSSIADQTMDIQRIKSQLMRLLLDSLAQTIRPRSWIVEGQVNLDDALNSEVGAIVRMRAPGMMGDLSTPFVGQAALPVLDYMDNVREDRTGVTRASQGLDPDALQSSTRVAVAATLEKAQQHIGMIARIFAETGVKRLFRILLRLVTTHQDKARVVRLRNQWVEVNPAEWDKSMDVYVNTALGTGQKADNMEVLTQILQKQEQILQTLGPQNPLVSVAQYSNTLRRMCELAGFRDSSQFFSPVAPDWQPPPPQPNPAQDPRNDPRAQAALILAQAQTQQTQADILKKQGELQLSREKMFMDDATARYRIEADYRARLAQTQAQFGMQTQQIAANIEQQNREIASDEKTASLDRMSDHVQNAADQQHEQAMAAQQQAHEQQMASQQQQAAAEQQDSQQQFQAAQSAQPQQQGDQNADS